MLIADTSQEHILSGWQKSTVHLVLQYWPEYMTTLHLRWFPFRVYIFQEITYTEHIHLCVWLWGGTSFVRCCMG